MMDSSCYSVSDYCKSPSVSMAQVNILMPDIVLTSIPAPYTSESLIPSHPKMPQDSTKTIICLQHSPQNKHTAKLEPPATPLPLS